MAQSQLLLGKVVVITGAASKIGEAIARRFVADGAKVIHADTHSNLPKCQNIASTLNPINNTAPMMAEAMEYDVLNGPSDIHKLIQDAIKAHNAAHLDIFYSNAGLNDNVSCTDIDNFRKTMQVNVESVIETVKHASAAMVGNPNGGCVLCTGSTVGLLGDVVPSAYSVSKNALVDVVRAAAADLATKNVRVNAISPHRVVDSAFDKRVLEHIFPDASAQELLPLINRYNVKARLVKDDDVAKAAVFLASDYGKSVNGHNLVLSGTFTL